jgi:hypothetical protein
MVLQKAGRRKNNRQQIINQLQFFGASVHKLRLVKFQVQLNKRVQWRGGRPETSGLLPRLLQYPGVAKDSVIKTIQLWQTHLS